MVLANKYLGRGTTTQSGGTKPLIGYKKAYMHVKTDGTAYFDAYQTQVGYTAIAEAACHYTNHWRGFRGTRPAINKNCSCGFHAYRSREDALSHTGYTVKGSEVLLKTVLSGYFIEHELGYRAEKQRVVEVCFGRCVWCQQPSQAVNVSSGRANGICLEHACSSAFTREMLTFEEFQQRFVMPDGSKFPAPTVRNISKRVEAATRYELDHYGEKLKLNRRGKQSLLQRLKNRLLEPVFTTSTSVHVTVAN